MSAGSPSFVRALWVGRVLHGSALLLAPVGDPLGDRGARVFARVLGARQLLQAAVVRPGSARGQVLAGAAVDGAHAASMVLLALVDPRRRALAGANALAASAFALGGLCEAERG
ncbi:MAG: hypothetical protein DLM64_15985 [Solirubrobacterales bacterium]|nr:MAG: hypothetical protein DLM64_15985 [Solirubrobacterales bacterium]